MTHTDSPKYPFTVLCAPSFCCILIPMPSEQPPDTRYVDCDVHGPQRRAYFVCRHLLETRDVTKSRALIGLHVPWKDVPTMQGAGTLCCNLKPAADHTVEEVELICQDTLVDLGILLPSETLLT